MDIFQFKKRRGWLVMFLLLTGLFAAVGLVLDAKFYFLSWEGVFLSSRAWIAAQGDPRSLINIGLVYPPLAYYLAVIFAYLKLPHPSIWLSAATGALILMWFLARLMKPRDLGLAVNRRMIFFMMIILLVQPGMIHGACLGNTVLIYQGLMLAAIYWLGRFVLDVEIMDRAKRSGRLSAWLDSEEYQHDRLRYLWGSALALGLAGFTRFELIYSLLILVPLTPFFIPREERGDLWKITTVCLLLYSPILATQLIWGYLSWVFTHDFFYVLHHPTTYFRYLDTESFLRADILHLKGNVLGVMGYLVMGTAVSFPLFYYLLFRMRSWTFAGVLLVPFAVEGFSAWQGGSLLSRDFFNFAPFLCAVILILGVRYQRIQGREMWLCMAAMVICTVSGWCYFSQSPFAEERIWGNLFREPRKMARFEVERKISHELQKFKPNQKILMDERAGYAVLTLTMEPRLFVMPYQSRFPVCLANPEQHVDYLLIRPNVATSRVQDQVAERWKYLDADKKNAFRRVLEIPPWELWERTDRPQDARAR